jgi:hypothetical protein
MVEKGMGMTIRVRIVMFTARQGSCLVPVGWLSSRVTTGYFQVLKMDCLPACSVIIFQ